jgi:hypothetical protein
MSKVTCLVLCATLLLSIIGGFAQSITARHANSAINAGTAVNDASPTPCVCGSNALYWMQRTPNESPSP